MKIIVYWNIARSILAGFGRDNYGSVDIDVGEEVWSGYDEGV